MILADQDAGKIASHHHASSLIGRTIALDACAERETGTPSDRPEGAMHHAQDRMAEW